MTININKKGKAAEREIANLLNHSVNKIRQNRGLVLFSQENALFQRNQLQSAVGGSDLVNPFKLAIEIKRCETLNINTWWKQVVTAAEPGNEIPILIYRQSRKQWRVIMCGYFELGAARLTNIRADISIDDFVTLFEIKYASILDSEL